MLTDLIVLISLIFLIWRGASRGFIRSLLGPAAFLTATAVAYGYYHATQNLFISLAIGLLGPVILYGLLIFLLRMFKTKEGNTPPSFLSRTIGGAATACWGCLIILPILFLLALIPPVTPLFANIGANVKQSNVHRVIEPFLKPFVLPKSISSPSLESLREDPQIQTLLNDPDFLKAAEKMDYPAMMSNPKLLKLAQDPEFVKKLLGVYGQQQKNPPGVMPKPTTESNQP